MDKFKLVSKFKPAGDQPKAIDALTNNILAGKTRQTLLGVTGSGKTFTMANVITRLNRPTLILSPNKVLAAQLYGEFKQFFPENAVEYFISYYDYYQPEAYIPQTDTYIEKDSAVNEHIDKLRLKATTSLLTRKDVIVVASVSCIYNIGSPDSFREMRIYVKKGAEMTRSQLSGRLIKIQYHRDEMEFTSGNFRMRGPFTDIMTPYSQNALRVEIAGKTIAHIYEIHPITGNVLAELDEAWIYPAKHFVATDEDTQSAIDNIRRDLDLRHAELLKMGKELEAYRLKQRTEYDLEMLQQAGFCPGIENYSRYIDGRKPGERPACLLDYFKKYDDFLMMVDESHVSLPQVRGMFNGDRARKQMLVDFGFRLPSALDNRPLKFDEFEKLLPSTIFVSATPGPYELTVCGNNIVEQVIRPTGLLDPKVYMHPTAGQIDHLVEKINEHKARGERTLVLALTKKTAEDLSAYFTEKNIKTRYLHSDIEALDRVEILKDFRQGKFDVLVGINLLREGIDIPQVGFVAILGADNEGFLRNTTTLIQISGRAARNADGEVVLYADRKTDSIKYALNEMNRRRALQEAYNKEHHITPKTIQKTEVELKEFEQQTKSSAFGILSDTLPTPTLKNLKSVEKDIEQQMLQAAEALNFELAAELRDRLYELRQMSVKAPSKKK
ncbi:excinuclease ABC subunit UvrB [Candidatus Avelusimicrobium fimicolum]|uniref:excinuclease ABC subunit UvrB n=1 Tax=Candidatus Avelusimicrobium TaxID=2840538 RepID=UPI002A9037C1|nr:excinuclease ABC subunit UvrB [Spirochaetia bacterium]MDY3910664.1 excinuclease ABC subunit UvrB [Elusimicrobiaceae bacterium]